MKAFFQMSEKSENCRALLAELAIKYRPLWMTWLSVKKMYGPQWTAVHNWLETGGSVEDCLCIAFHLMGGLGEEATHYEDVGAWLIDLTQEEPLCWANIVDEKDEG